jgi:hypothetical protein
MEDTSLWSIDLLPQSEGSRKLAERR